MKTKRLPYTVAIDTAEQHPWTFDGIMADSPHQDKKLIIDTTTMALGRHPHGLGDYSIEGERGLIHVERKSISDLQGTLLGFKDGRRERFEQELSNLAEVHSPPVAYAAVIVEGTHQDCIDQPVLWGEKPADVNRKILSRSIQALMSDYRLPWFFAESRRMAEVMCFRYLDRYWRKKMERQRKKKSLQRELMRFKDI